MTMPRDIRESLGSETEGFLDPLLATFDKKLKADMAGHLTNIRVAGNAEMITWGKTNAGIPIAFEGPPLQEAVDWAKTRSAKLVTQMNVESKRRIAKTISDGIKNKRGVAGLGRDIRKTFDNMSVYRGQLIARTETANALSNASLDRMKDMGIEGKEWITAGDNRVSPECMGNQGEGVIPRNQTFGGGTMAPPQHPACRCALAPAILKVKKAPPTKAPPPTKPKPTPSEKPKLSGEKWAKSLSRDETRSVRYWQGSGYEKMRLAQQTGRGPTEIKGVIKDITRAINKSKAYKGNVFRGLNNLDAKTFNQIKNAKTIQWNALSSSSKTEKAAARFLYGDKKSVMFKIQNKTGVDLTPVVGRQEAEVLLRQGANYRVVSATEKTYSTVAGKTKKALEMVLEEI